MSKNLNAPMADNFFIDMVPAQSAAKVPEAPKTKTTAKTEKAQTKQPALKSGSTVKAEKTARASAGKVQSKPKTKPQREITMKIYTLEEAAEILQVAKRTAYNYVKTGKLKAAKRGKYWRITEENLKAFALPDES